MRRYLIIMLLLLPLIAFALEIISDPYDSIDYDAINVYHYNECHCPTEKAYKLPKSYDDLFLELDI
jgi:hypothetical protein